MSDMTIKGVVSLDTSNADIGLARVETNATKMAAGVKKAGTEAGKGFDGVGAGGDAASKKVDTSTRSMIASIQRLTAQMDAGEKNSSKYFEAIAKQRGISSDVLRPYLTQLDAARSRQDAAASSLRGFGGVADQARATMLSLGTAFAGMFSARAFFSAADAVTSLNNQLKLATGSAEDAKSAYDGLFDVAQRSRTGFVELGSTFASISRAADGLGLSQQQLLKLTETIGNAITVSGASASASSAALVQLSQGLASGVLRGEELNSIMEQTPRLARAIADGLGVPIGKLREMGKAGELSAQAVIEALQSQSAVLTGEVQDSVLTVGQAFTQLKNSATGLSGEIDRVTGSTSTMAGVMSAASGSLDEISRAMRGVEGSGTDLAGVVGGGIATVFETVTVLGSNVAYTIKQIGNELGGLAAQAVAVAKLDFSAAGEIGRMMREDSAKARQEIDALTDRVLSARSVSDRIRSSLSGVDTRAEDARLARTGASGVRSIPVTPAAKKPAGSRGREGDQFAAEREAAKEWASYWEKFSDIAATAEGKTLGLSKAQGVLVEYLKSPAYATNTEEMRQATLEKAYYAIESERVAAALKEEQKAIAASNAAFAPASGKAESLEADLLAQREQLALIGASAAALADHTARQYEATAARKEFTAATLEQFDPGNALVDVYKRQAEALRGLAETARTTATVRQQVDQYRELWESVDSFAENAFMDIAMNGEDAFKRIGESIKREVIQMLYEMTVRKWIFQIAGVSTGGGGGVDWMSLASKAYDYYAGGSAGSAVGSAASAAGSSYAAASVSDAAMVSAGSSTAAGSSSSAMMGYMSYAALIAAAVMIAQNLYAKGYTRAAIGEGGSETARFGQYSSYTTDPNTQRAGAMQNSPAMLMTNDMRKFNDMLGMSEQWADILSGTTRMATLVGRKLSAYGYEATIAGGDAEVGGFARYKGGVFRSNKTVAADVDPRDAAAFDAVVESTIEGSKAMARAMGLSDEAINQYTGSLKVNFKGAKTAEEQSQRMAEAMDNLNYELLKTASGGKLAREDFKAFMEGIQKDIQQAGISAEGIADILIQGMTGRLSGADVGAQLSDMILGGIYNAIASSGAAQIANLFMTQIITPIFAAIASGVPVAQAVSAAAIKQTVETAKQYMAVVKATFNDPEFRAFMEELKAGLSSAGAAAAGVPSPAMRSYGPSPAQTAAEEAKREKEQLERELLRLQGNTVELRRRELLELKPGNRALQQRIWALEDEQRVTEQRNDLERQRLEILGDTAALRKLERDALEESNRALYDEIQALKDAAELKNVWRDLTDSIEDEIKRIRGDVLGDSLNGLSYVQAQFATMTAQARALDKDAAGKLPDLAGQLSDLYRTSSSSRSEFEFQINSMLASLEETNRITRSATGVTETTSAVEDKALAKKVEELSGAVFLLQDIMQKTATTTADTAKILDRVTSGGNAMRTKAA